MDEEMAALDANATWELVALLEDKKTIGCKWVYKVKHNANGSVSKLLTNRRSTLKCKHKFLLKRNYNMMLITQNITSRTPQGSCHVKYTNLCNEKKRTKPSTPRNLTKRPNHK